ncbi:MAG: HEAT repeat domain-containing protein [Planctomycetes bacterium]|nr:HEAT repeat domain-containing protein [Planctomycetota bacterium]
MNRLGMLTGVAGVSALLCGCGSADKPKFDSGSAEYQYYANLEYNVLSDVVIDNFYRQLTQLSQAVAEQNAEQEQSLRAQLRQEALQYRGAVENGLTDGGSARRRSIASAMAGFTGDAKYAVQLAQIATDPSENESVSTFASLGLAALGDRINESAERDQVMAYVARLMLPSAATWPMRVNAVMAFGKAYSVTRGDVLTPLTDVIVNDPHATVRRQALAVARDIGDSAVLPEVTRIALKDPDASIRSAAAVTLGGITDPRALEALKEAQLDASPMVRAQAVYSLTAQRTIEPDLVNDLIIDGLADFDEKVRENAAKAAGMVGDQKFTRSLLQSLSDASDGVRVAVINALAVVIPYEARKDGFPIVAMLDEGEPLIVTAAHRALKKITNVQLERDAEVWRKWYYENFQELDPEWIYRDQPRPRYAPSGIRTTNRPRSTPRTSTPRSTPRTSSPSGR